MARSLDLVLKSDPSEIGRLVDRLEAFSLACGLAPDVGFRLMLALDETVSNVIRHGFEDPTEHRITVHVEVGQGSVTAVVTDEGTPYDPRQAPAADLEAGIEARRAGGLGLHLVRSCMDSMHYERDGERNVLTLTTSTASRDTD